jgi:hypothetical protein
MKRVRARQNAAAIASLLKQIRLDAAAFDTLVTMFGADFAGSSPQ